METILVATDLSKMTDEVLNAGFDLARKMNARILLTVIINKNLDYFPADTGMIFCDQWEARKYLAEQQVDEIRMAHPDLKIDSLVCIGDPRDGIIKEAVANDASMIVLGTHGRGGLYHSLMGSTAEYVVRHSPLPVLVVPFNKLRH